MTPATLQLHGIDPERIRKLTAHMVVAQPPTTPGARVVKEPWREPRGRRVTGAASEIRAAMAKLGKFRAEELAKFCGHKLTTVRHVIARDCNAGNLKRRVLMTASAGTPRRYEWAGKIVVKPTTKGTK